MKFEDIVRLPDPRRSVKAEVREVVRDVQERPHVFVRVRLTGWHFPQRAPEPFLTIGRAVSAFVLIGREGTSADAYFDVRPPAAERVSFGYGKVVSWDFDLAIEPGRIERLDRGQLPRNYVELREAT